MLYILENVAKLCEMTLRNSTAPDTLESWIQPSSMYALPKSRVYITYLAVGLWLPKLLHMTNMMMHWILHNSYKSTFSYRFLSSLLKEWVNNEHFLVLLPTAKGFLLPPPQDRNQERRWNRFKRRVLLKTRRKERRMGGSLRLQGSKH